MDALAPHAFAEGPPARAQLSLAKLLRMSLGSLRHQLVSSTLQVVTIAATGAFLAFVLAELVTARASAGLATAVTGERGKAAELAWMLAVALAVCAISNVVSMLLSVTRRFREIGTMKCLGAFDGTVLVLFLIEAAIMGGAGSLLGATAGTAVALLAALVRHGAQVFTAGAWAGFAGAWAATLAMVAALSLAGAAYPAWVASRMLPVEAMRRT
jgi:hypothetical protein